MSETPSPEHVPSSPPEASSTAGSSKGRTLALVGLLLVMGGALWYDRMVARPAVEKAYAQISRLNEDVNATAGRKYLTKTDIQNALGRAPIETFSENGYLVEVYGWRAGLPIKTHNYYAVYTDAAPHIFQMHYMNELDRTDIARPPILIQEGPIDAPPALFSSPPGGPDAPGGGQGRRRGMRPPGDSQRPPSDTPAEAPAEAPAK